VRQIRVGTFMHMKTIEARVTRNIKEQPGIEECNIWNIEAAFLESLPHEAMHLTADPVEIGVEQIAPARTDISRTTVTIRTQCKSSLQPGEMIHLGFE
jgi:hypothetical protein